MDSVRANKLNTELHSPHVREAALKQLQDERGVTQFFVDYNEEFKELFEADSVRAAAAAESKANVEGANAKRRLSAGKMLPLPEAEAAVAAEAGIKTSARKAKRRKHSQGVCAGFACKIPTRATAVDGTIFEDKRGGLHRRGYSKQCTGVTVGVKERCAECHKSKRSSDVYFSAVRAEAVRIGLVQEDASFETVATLYTADILQHSAREHARCQPPPPPPPQPAAKKVGDPLVDLVERALKIPGFKGCFQYLFMVATLTAFLCFINFQPMQWHQHRVVFEFFITIFIMPGGRRILNMFLGKGAIGEGSGNKSRERHEQEGHVRHPRDVNVSVPSTSTLEDNVRKKGAMVGSWHDACLRAACKFFKEKGIMCIYVSFDEVHTVEEVTALAEGNKVLLNGIDHKFEGFDANDITSSKQIAGGLMSVMITSPCNTYRFVVGLVGAHAFLQGGGRPHHPHPRGRADVRRRASDRGIDGRASVQQGWR